MGWRALGVPLAAPLLATLSLGLSGLATQATADDGPAPTPAPAEEDRQEQIERQTTKGLAAFRRGNHEEALTRMERLEKLDPKSPLPRWVKARILTRTGKYAEALALATEAAHQNPDDRRAEALRFELLRRLGRFDEASTAASAALEARPKDLVARTMRGMALEERGRRTEALAEYDRVIDLYNAEEPGSAQSTVLPEELTFVAQAALRATRLSPNPADDLTMAAVRLLGKRIEADPEDVDLLLAYADVYQANKGKNGQSTAGKYYKKVIDANPEIAEARVGLGKIALVYYDSTRAKDAAQRALLTNPSLVPAMNLLARIHVSDGDYEKADAMWERASKVNPLDKEARSIRAARLFITGDHAGFEALAKEILEHDPTYGALYTIVADLVGERQRRYDVAADLSAKAIAIDPTDDEAYVVQGVNLMNLGREKEAKASFDKATAAAKGWDDVVRENFIQVLEVLDTFVELKSPNFIVRQHPLESAVMAPYLIPLLEKSWKDLSEKYGFTPQGPVLVESFHRHDDFSARSVGAPNIPALGVCFGKVITLDGPLSRGLGEFSWARTAWHEFAHVVTLQLSKGQVPRWLTEGLSVHEEKAHKAQWGREMDRDLFDRWKNGRLLKMSEINHAFRGPDVMFAYFQGGLIADYLQKEHGFEAVTKMLKRYADDVPTEKLFVEVLGIPLDEFDRKFAEYVGTLVGSYKLVPRWDDDSKKSFEERVKKDPKDAEAWARLAWAHLQRGSSIDAGAALQSARALTPDAPEVILLEGELAARSNRLDLAKGHFERFLKTGADDVNARLTLAKIALSDKKSDEAVTQLEAAKAAFPRFVGRGNPYVELATLYEGAGEPEKAVKEYEAFADIAQEDYGVRRKLASWYESKKDDSSLMRVSEEMIEISPFGAPRGKPPDLDLHKRFARALERAGRKKEAAREWRVQTLLIDSLPEEKRKEAGAIEARLALGELLLDLAQPEEALEQALAVLALDPTSTAGQALKARAQRAGDPK